MYNSVVTNDAVISNSDSINISSEDGTVPDGSLSTNKNFSNNGGVWSNKWVEVDFWLQIIDGHNLSVSREWLQVGNILLESGSLGIQS